MRRQSIAQPVEVKRNLTGAPTSVSAVRAHPCAHFFLITTGRDAGEPQARMPELQFNDFVALRSAVTIVFAGALILVRP